MYETLNLWILLNVGWKHCISKIILNFSSFFLCITVYIFNFWYSTYILYFCMVFLYFICHLCTTPLNTYCICKNRRLIKFSCFMFHVCCSHIDLFRPKYSNTRFTFVTITLFFLLASCPIEHWLRGKITFHKGGTKDTKGTVKLINLKQTDNAMAKNEKDKLVDKNILKNSSNDLPD